MESDMSNIRYREVKGKLGVFGCLSRLLLVGWQFLMLAWFVSYLSDVAPIVEGINQRSEAEVAGAGLGIALASGIILFFWVGGTIIFGIFALLTRRAKVMVPITDNETS